MTSCELARSSAYNEDLRWRIVWQTEAPGMKNEQVAQNPAKIPYNWHSQEGHLFLHKGPGDEVSVHQTCH